MLRDIIKMESSLFLKVVHSTLNAWAGMEMKNEMAEDMEFSSPSTAGVYCLGQKTCNGWTEWKDANGITLDAIYRKKSEE